jgi:hypothetical protein
MKMLRYKGTMIGRKRMEGKVHAGSMRHVADRRQLEGSLKMKRRSGYERSSS